jgi:uncharacterized protein YheU (UPF0270 family)
MENKSHENTPPPLEIPKDVLSPDALNGIIEAFILREGTDYGRDEIGHEKKVDQVRKQLDRGHIKIVFDAESESVTLMTEHDWRKLQP